MSTLEESLNALKFSAVAIEVVPLQLESRHVGCKEAVRCLPERWYRASGGERLRDGSLEPNLTEDVAASASLDADEAEELFETIEALECDLQDTWGQLKWAQKMAAANEAQVNDYKDLVKHLEQELRKQRDSADRELAIIRVRNACEITRLQLYRRLTPHRSELRTAAGLSSVVTLESIYATMQQMFYQMGEFNNKVKENTLSNEDLERRIRKVEFGSRKRVDDENNTRVKAYRRINNTGDVSDADNCDGGGMNVSNG
ncbi:hypothetical protein HPB49_013435 [Dermacentor silvarum]|uniref:Uncharacterized protein n=1 Tax=Dermacentor silvarum TaxID=543639 RepID=A0ACB8E036_DERSI|nr:hypothetical protein HPB49_013435 [Dermacentor silvarum]